MNLTMQHRHFIVIKLYLFLIWLLWNRVCVCLKRQMPGAGRLVFSGVSSELEMRMNVQSLQITFVYFEWSEFERRRSDLIYVYDLWEGMNWEVPREKEEIMFDSKNARMWSSVVVYISLYIM